MRILIFGASGFLGKKLFTHFAKNHTVKGTTHSKHNTLFAAVDITKKEAVDILFQDFKPEIVIHCAAIVDVKKCEENHLLADNVHIIGTRNIAELCAQYNTKLIYISTDYVFDGKTNRYTEKSVTSPLNYYGITKLKGEHIVQELVSNNIIIRSSILYGFNDIKDKANFTFQVLSSLQKGNSVQLDDERIKYPIFIDDMAKCIGHLITSKVTGIFNVAIDKGYTRYEWAKLIAKIFDLDSSLIQPQNDTSHNQIVPKNVKLKIDKLLKTGFTPLNLEEGLRKLKKQLQEAL